MQYVRQYALAMGWLPCAAASGVAVAAYCGLVLLLLLLLYIILLPQPQGATQLRREACKKLRDAGYSSTDDFGLDPLCKSQLNGSNGEYTNSDDVGMVTFADQADGRGNAGPPRHAKPKGGYRLDEGSQHRGKGVPLEGSGGKAKQDELARCDVVSKVSIVDDEVCKYLQKGGECLNNRCRFHHLNDVRPSLKRLAEFVHIEGLIVDECSNTLSLVVYGREPHLFYNSGEYRTSEICHYSHVREDEPVTTMGEIFGVSIGVRRVSTAEGTVYYAIPAGTFFPWGVKESRSGTLILDVMSVNPGEAVPCYGHLSMPPNTEMHIPSMPVIVFTPGLRLITKQYTKSHPDESNYNGSLAYLQRSYPTAVTTAWQFLLMSTGFYFQARQMARQRDSMVRRSGILPGVPCKLIYPPEVIDLHFTLGTAPPQLARVEEPVDPVACEYELRDGVEFEAGPGTWQPRDRILRQARKWGKAEWILPKPKPATGLFGWLDPDCTDCGYDMVRRPLVSIMGADAVAAVDRASRLGVPIDLTAGRSCPPVFLRPGYQTDNDGRPRKFTVERHWHVRGTGAGFVRYTESTDSHMLAMKRAVGVRDGEAALVSSERFMVAAAMKTTWFRNMWDKLSWPSTPLDDSASFVGRWSLTGAYSAGPRDGAWHVIDSLWRDFTPYTLSQCIAKYVRVARVCGVDITHTMYDPDNFAYSKLLTLCAEDEGTEAFRKALAAVEHAKRERKKKFVDDVKIHYPSDPMVDRPEAKLKNEYLKQGKVPRWFVDLAAGSECAGDLPMRIKAMLDGVHEFTIGRIKCIIIVALKPNEAQLVDLFQAVLAARGHMNTMVAVAHGDDILMSFCVGGKCWTTNADVSSCDSSNRRFMHTVLGAMYDKFSTTASVALIAQCRKPVTVRNPAYPSDYFTVWPDGKGGVCEYSGSTNTTAINTLTVCMLLGAVAGALNQLCAGAYGIKSEHPKSDVEWTAWLEATCRQVGYIVKAKTCYRDGEFVPELMEFLKRSYCRETKQVFLQLGAIFRNFGGMEGAVSACRLGWTVHQFASAKAIPNAVMNRVCSMVVNGLVNEPPSIVHDALRARFDDTEAPAMVRKPGDGMSVVPGGGDDYIKWVVTEKSCPQMIITPRQSVNNAILRRYDVTYDQLQELANKILAANSGEVRDAAASRFFYMDYDAPEGGVPPDLAGPPVHKTPFGQGVRL